MFKAITALGLYFTAFICIYCGMDLMGDADWPTTAIQLNGAIFVVMGCLSKLAGHVVLLSTTRAI